MGKKKVIFCLLFVSIDEKSFFGTYTLDISSLTSINIFLKNEPVVVFFLCLFLHLLSLVLYQIFETSDLKEGQAWRIFASQNVSHHKQAFWAKSIHHIDSLESGVFLSVVETFLILDTVEKCQII